MALGGSLALAPGPGLSWRIGPSITTDRCGERLVLIIAHNGARVFVSGRVIMSLTGLIYARPLNGRTGRDILRANAAVPKAIWRTDVLG